MSDHFLTYKYAFHRENIYKNIKFHMNNFRDICYVIENLLEELHVILEYCQVIYMKI